MRVKPQTLDININIVECKWYYNKYIYRSRKYININIVECKFFHTGPADRPPSGYKYKHSGM